MRTLRRWTLILHERTLRLKLFDALMKNKPDNGAATGYHRAAPSDFPRVPERGCRSDDLPFGRLGIYCIGDASIFIEVGRRVCVRYLLYLLVMTVLIALISLPFFSLQIGNTQNGNQYSELYQMVLNIIPDNLFTPFSRGNTLQIMFVGIIIGLTMLVIGKNTQVVAELAEQLGFIVDGIMGFISKLVPVFVFGSLFNIIVSSDLSSLAAGGKFFAGTLAGCILLILFHKVLACVKMHISPLELWKRTFSTFIIAISTASSSAAFAENKRTCTEKLGISHHLANFGVPFGQLLYPPGASVLFWFAAVCVAESSGA